MRRRRLLRFISACFGFRTRFLRLIVKWGMLFPRQGWNDYPCVCTVFSLLSSSLLDVSFIFDALTIRYLFPGQCMMHNNVRALCDIAFYSWFSSGLGIILFSQLVPRDTNPLNANFPWQQDHRAAVIRSQLSIARLSFLFVFLCSQSERFLQSIKEPHFCECSIWYCIVFTVFFYLHFAHVGLYTVLTASDVTLRWCLKLAYNASIATS